MIAGLPTVSLFFAGLLAGEELIVCLGVAPALARLESWAHILARQQLILRLRVVVPILLLLTIATSLAATFSVTASAHLDDRLGALVALGAFSALTLAGTVPINQTILAWDAGHLPQNWARVLRRWERLDSARLGLAIIAFALQISASRV